MFILVCFKDLRNVFFAITSACDIGQILVRQFPVLSFECVSFTNVYSKYLCILITNYYTHICI